MSDGTFLDQAHPFNARQVVREMLSHVVEQPAINLIDDLEVPRQQGFEPAHRPTFQCLGQQGVIRVAQRASRNVPGKVPGQTGFVEENAQQLGNRKSRVSII